MASLLYFAVGLLVGLVLAFIGLTFFIAGTLLVYDNADGSYLFLELEKDIAKIRRKRHVIFKVENKTR